MTEAEELLLRILRTIRDSEWDDCPGTTMMELRRLEAEYEVAAFGEALKSRVP